jgi:hypothetical protein
LVSAWMSITISVTLASMAQPVAAVISLWS